MGFIEDWADFVTESLPITRRRAEISGAILLSTAVGHNRFVWTDIGELRLNLVGIVIGGSAVECKSPERNYFNKPLIDTLSKKVGQKLTLAAKFTTESMTKYLSYIGEKGETHNEGIVLGDELTRMFMEAKHKDYMTGSMEYLSQLCDNYVEETMTIKRGTEYAPFCYVNMLTYTTFYILRMLEDDFFIQGTGARFLWYVSDKVDLVERNDSFFDFTGGPDKIRAQKIESFANRLLQIRKDCTRAAAEEKAQVIPAGKANDVLLDYYVETQNRARKMFNEDALDPEVGLVGKIAANSFKLAALHAIGCNRSGLAGEAITIEDAEWAIHKANQSVSDYEKLEPIKKRLFGEKEISTHYSDWRTMLRVIDSHGGQASRTDIINSTGWDKIDIDKLENTMLEADIVEKYIEKGVTKPTIYLRRKK
jgi:hypothetical protein